MSIPATEIAVLTLKPDSTIEDVSTPAGQIFNQMLKTIKSQAGFQRQYWGRQLENPNHLVLSIDWDDLGSHRTWMETPSYKQFFSEISPLLDLDNATAPNLIHLNCVPHPPDLPRSTPVTELAFFALPKSASDSQKSALEDTVLKLAQTCMEGSSGSEDKATSFATGWVLEDMDHHAGTEGKAISFGLMLGWESKEAHLRAKESEAFQKAVQPVRDLTLPPEPGRGLYHVRFVGGGVVE